MLRKGRLEEPAAATEQKGSGSTAFLLAQVGAEAAAQFGERMTRLRLTRPHAGILRLVVRFNKTYTYQSTASASNFFHR